MTARASRMLARVTAGSDIAAEYMPATARSQPGRGPSPPERPRGVGGASARHLRASPRISAASILAHLRKRCNTPQDMETALAPTTEDAYQRTAVIGRALGDPKRLCVLESLADGEVSVSDLSTRVGCQVPNMSQHLAVLRAAGLVTTRRDGSTVYYRLAGPRVLEAYRLIQTIAR